MADSLLSFLVRESVDAAYGILMGSELGFPLPQEMFFLLRLRSFYELLAGFVSFDEAGISEGSFRFAPSLQSFPLFLRPPYFLS